MTIKNRDIIYVYVKWIQMLKDSDLHMNSFLSSTTLIIILFKNHNNRDTEYNGHVWVQKSDSMLGI